MVEEARACPLTKGERILVAVDGSRHSDKALDQAMSMARMCNSELFAISVIDLTPEQLALAPALEEKLSKEARGILDRTKQEAEAAGLSIETIVHFGGQPHEFILKEAREMNIDLIVMGTRGRTALQSMLIGGVAQKVIAHAPCAVLVTPA
jgi:nucleotide-binding universal stress UspA family protein